MKLLLKYMFTCISYRVAALLTLSPCGNVKEEGSSYPHYSCGVLEDSRTLRRKTTIYQPITHPQEKF